MRFPWANVALVALFTFELVTGYLGLTHSNPEWIAAMHLHRITGFSILALFLWKSRNILGSFRTLQNWKASPETMLASTVLLAGLLTVLGLGLAWSQFGPYSWLGFSGTTIHLNLALLLIPLLLWHSLRHRISFRVRYVAGRRNFLRFGGVAVAGLALWQLTDRLNILAGGPVADRRFTGSHPEDGPDFPVTMWLNDRTPLEPVYNLFRISTAKARTTICRLVLSFLSQFFQRRRHFSSQPKDRSTTHRFGSTTKVCSSLRFTTSTEAPSRLCTAVAKGFPVYPPSTSTLCTWLRLARRRSNIAKAPARSVTLAVVT